MIWIRWLAVVPVAFVAWYAVFLFGMALIIGIGSLCPSEDIISGSCVAWWASYAERAAFIFCSGLAAFLVVVSSALVAPSHRRIVAWVSFGLGFIVAAFMSLPLSAFGELFAATVAGLVGVSFVTRFLLHTMLPNKPLEPTP